MYPRPELYLDHAGIRVVCHTEGHGFTGAIKLIRTEALRGSGRAPDRSAGCRARLDAVQAVRAGSVLRTERACASRGGVRLRAVLPGASAHTGTRPRGFLPRRVRCAVGRFRNFRVEPVALDALGGNHDLRARRLLVCALTGGERPQAPAHGGDSTGDCP